MNCTSMEEFWPAWLSILVLALFLAMAVAVFILLLPPAHGCTPDTVNYSPTPCLVWDYDESQQNGITGYRVYYAEPGQQYGLGRSFPVGCWIMVDEDTGLSSRQYCYGTDFPVPVQRWVERELELVDYAVKAIGRDGVMESLVFSNTVEICQPQICRPPGPCN